MLGTQVPALVRELDPTRRNKDQRSQACECIYSTKTCHSQINIYIIIISHTYICIYFLMCLFSTHCVFCMEPGTEQCRVSNLEGGIMEWAGHMHRQREAASLQAVLLEAGRPSKGRHRAGWAQVTHRPQRAAPWGGSLRDKRKRKGTSGTEM